MSDQVTSVRSLDPKVWFTKRALEYKPLHFITAKTPLTKDSALWIVHNLTGRYTFAGHMGLNEDLEETIFPSFEELSDAVLYELRWS